MLLCISATPQIYSFYFIAQHEIFFRKHRKKDSKCMLTTDINIAFITFIKSSLTAVILFCQLATHNK